MAWKSLPSKIFPLVPDWLKIAQTFPLGFPSDSDRQGTCRVSCGAILLPPAGSSVADSPGMWPEGVQSIPPDPRRPFLTYLPTTSFHTIIQAIWPPFQIEDIGLCGERPVSVGKRAFLSESAFFRPDLFPPEQSVSEIKYVQPGFRHKTTKRRPLRIMTPRLPWKISIIAQNPKIIGATLQTFQIFVPPEMSVDDFPDMGGGFYWAFFFGLSGLCCWLDAGLTADQVRGSDPPSGMWGCMCICG